MPKSRSAGQQQTGEVLPRPALPHESKPPRIAQGPQLSRAAELRVILTRASHEYYVLESPTMQDTDHDKPFHEKQKQKKNFPERHPPDSPTRRMSAKVKSKMANNKNVAGKSSMIKRRGT